MLFLLVPLLAACSTLAPPTPLPPASSYAAGQGGVRLHYLDFGGRGEPVLLLPGAGNTAWIYSDLGADLARDHRVLALSRRGHGELEMPPSGYDQATLAEDIRLFLDQHGIRKVHLVGHSAAGGEMTLFAGTYPDRVASLVYLDAAYDRSAQGPVESSVPERPVPPTAADRSSIDSFVAYLFATRPIYARYPREIVEQDTRKSLVMRPDGTAVSAWVKRNSGNISPRLRQRRPLIEACAPRRWQSMPAASRSFDCRARKRPSSEPRSSSICV